MVMHLRDFARSERVSCLLPATLVIGGSPYAATCVNLSLSGGFFQFNSKLPQGTRLDVLFDIPAGSQRIRGTVVRFGVCPAYVLHPRVDDLCVSVTGVGVEFEQLPLDKVEALSAYLDELLEK